MTSSKRPRAKQRRETRQLKRTWLPECFTLPDTIEEIERGVTAEVQAARDNYVLLPIGARLVAVPKGEARDGSRNMH